MKQRFVMTLTICLVAGVAVSGGAISDEDKQGITAAALGYMDGALDSDAGRVAEAVHPELTKVAVMTFPEPGGTGLRKMGHSQLVEVVRARATHLEPEERNIEVEIFDAREGIASAKVVSSKYYDYLQLARIDGRWKIVNVLWAPTKPAVEEGPPAEQLTKDGQGIRGAALDYLEGFFSGDAERMARGVHPELTKVSPRALPNGKTFIDQIGAGLLVAYTGTKAGMLAEDKRAIEIEIYDVNGDIATAGAMSSMFHDYLQLARIDGRWRIVNVLWTMNPSAPVPERK